MTFSVTGRCEQTGMLGVAIATSSICVASRCPWARAGVGAVATQNITDPSIGNTLLDKLAAGRSAEAALAELLSSGAQNLEYRQIAVVDNRGGFAHHSGDKTLGISNVTAKTNCVAAGNILSATEVTVTMAERFSATPALHLAPRLLGALQAGLSAGGEMGPVKSCGLLVVDEQPWPLVDLRCDWDDAPVWRLNDLWEAYQPQMDDYVVRALDPSSMPAYMAPDSR